MAQVRDFLRFTFNGQTFVFSQLDELLDAALIGITKIRGVVTIAMQRTTRRNPRRALSLSGSLMLSCIFDEARKPWDFVRLPCPPLLFSPSPPP